MSYFRQLLTKQGKIAMEIMKYAIPGYEDVTAEYLLGIFGNPIKHTLSPVIHDTLSDALGLSERYVPFCVEDE